RATLEEVKEADLIIHVTDAADPDMQGRVADVNSVLDQIEAGKAHDQLEIEAWNKIDMLDAEPLEDLELDCLLANRKAERIVKLAVSAHTGERIDVLLDAIETTLAERGEVMELVLPPAEGRALAWLMANADVISQDTDMETGAVRGRYKLSDVNAGRFRSQYPHIAAPLPREEY
ncbi:MAG: GTPase HflX, partial [Pseudomonadota bacterium]|nr:GTPase HflX [Pseudomonadota bacterium]